MRFTLFVEQRRKLLFAFYVLGSHSRRVFYVVRTTALGSHSFRAFYVVCRTDLGSHSVRFTLFVEQL